MVNSALHDILYSAWIVESGVALSLLVRLRDFGCVRHSSDLLRVVLAFVGPYARSCDAE